MLHTARAAHHGLLAHHGHHRHHHQHGHHGLLALHGHQSSDALSLLQSWFPKRRWSMAQNDKIRIPQNDFICIILKSMLRWALPLWIEGNGLLIKVHDGTLFVLLFETFVKSCFPAIFCASYVGVEKYLKIDNNTTRLKILYLKVWKPKRGSWFSSSCINSRKFYHLHFWNTTFFLLSSVKALQNCRGSIKNV